MKNLIFIFLAIFIALPAYAKCVGGNHIPMTSGSPEFCRQQAIQVQEQKAMELEIKRKETAAQKAKLEREQTVNSGTGSGSGNTNVILGAMGGSGGGVDPSEYGQSLVGVKSKHYLGLGLTGYVLSTQPGFKRQMPARFAPNNFYYHYYVNSNWSAGIMWQDFGLKGDAFDEITEQQEVDTEVTVTDPDTGEETTGVKTETKDVVLYAPGYDELQVQRLWLIMTFHINVTDEVEIAATGGQSLMNDVKFYKDGDNVETYSPPKPFLAEISVGYKPIDKDYMMFTGFRFVEAASDTGDYFSYNNPGGAEIFAGVQFGIM